MYSREELHRLPACLRIAIAVKDAEALSDPGTFFPYGGGPKLKVARITSGRFPAYTVDVPPYDEASLQYLIGITGRLNAAGHGASADNLSVKSQVWVHVDDPDYREAYVASRLTTAAAIATLVLDHVMNRELARSLGFTWLRLCPITRAVNSAGAQYEKWRNQDERKNWGPGTKLRTAPDISPDAWMLPAERARTRVMYAGFVEIAKMLNMLTGGGPASSAGGLQHLTAITGH